MNNALKAGDLVRFIAEETTGEITLGKTYTISEVDPKDDTVIIYGDDGDWWYYLQDELVLVSDDEEGGEAWTTP